MVNGEETLIQSHNSLSFTSVFFFFLHECEFLYDHKKDNLEVTLDFKVNNQLINSQTLL